MINKKLDQKLGQKITRLDQHALAKTPPERLTFLRQVLRLSREEMLGEYGIPKNSLLSWEHGSKNISDQNLHRLLDIYLQEGLIINLEWVRSGEGVAPYWASGADLSRNLKLEKLENLEKEKPKKNKPITDLNLNLNMNLNPKTDDFLLAQEVTYFRNLSEEGVAVILKSDDMAPSYYRGDMVGGRFKEGEDLYGLINKDCIVRTNDDKEYIRTLVKHAEEKVDRNGAIKFDLICKNPAAAYDAPAVLSGVFVQKAAPIIWIRRRDK